MQCIKTGGESASFCDSYEDGGFDTKTERPGNTTCTIVRAEGMFSTLILIEKWLHLSPLLQIVYCTLGLKLYCWMGGLRVKHAYLFKTQLQFYTGLTLLIYSELLCVVVVCVHSTMWRFPCAQLTPRDRKMTVWLENPVLALALALAWSLAFLLALSLAVAFVDR